MYLVLFSNVIVQYCYLKKLDKMLNDENDNTTVMRTVIV